MHFVPTVSLHSNATTVAEDDPAGSVGKPWWSASQLLSDLELRLALGTEPASAALRAQALLVRLRRLEGSKRFYSRSYEIDPVGTASAVLALRDALVLAGWNGGGVPGGGERLAALAEMEAVREPAIPPGVADRLRRVEDALTRCRTRLYDGLWLAEPWHLWPARWHAVFSRLSARGTRVAERHAPLPNLAPPESDLGRLQAHVLGQEVSGTVTGDGSLLRLRAETLQEAAAATAAVLRRIGGDGLAIVRGGEGGVLDAALARQNIGTLGAAARSPWRPALQVLPLALEHLYSPRDPARMMEALLLPHSPFHPLTRRLLCRALAEAPGVGGPAWEAAKESLHAALGAERYARESVAIHEWFESPGPTREEGAPRELVGARVAGVRDWLRQRQATPDDPVLPAAVAQAQALCDLVATDPRARLDPLALRHLFEAVANDASVGFTEEQIGRPHHVDDPGALWLPHKTIVWWHFIAGTERPAPAAPWSSAELQALAQAGIRFPDPGAQLANETERWRRAALLAGERLLLVTPQCARGEPAVPHPLWSEILARLSLSNEAAERITVDAADLRRGMAPPALLPEVLAMPPVPLPEARIEWRAPARVFREVSSSATSLETLLACPLRFTLERVARIRSGDTSRLPRAHLLAGTLGHRLVQLLVEQGALDRPSDDVEDRAGALLDELLPREAATLLAPGASFERTQLRAQLIDAMCTLARLLSQGRLSVEAVEHPAEATWEGSRLAGRIDLLLRDETGHRVVVDLKWGASTYRKRLKEGTAVQLAVYSTLCSDAPCSSAPVPAGYFSLSRATHYATREHPVPGTTVIEGATMDETWERLCRSMRALRTLLDAGRVPVTGLRDSPPLAKTLGVSPEEQDEYLVLDPDEACKYCSYDALCGRRWETLS